jgi:exopolyphosphatase/guanosine-5'-triphosphate,3'-diphosphate pyrophosphatase
MQRLASIDIGSQTIRLLIADVFPDGHLVPVARNHAVIRLGEGMLNSGIIKDASIARAVACIAHFIQQAQKLHPAGIYAVATACVRSAKNSDIFLNAVCNHTGVKPIVLTGQEEALTALAGARCCISSIPESMIVLDIGGGSTELVSIRNTNVIQTVSIPLGVIELTERYLHHDPLFPSDITRLQCTIQSTCKLHGLLEGSWKNHAMLLGTAGTVTTLAAMDLRMTEYSGDLINGHILTVQRLKQLYKSLLCKSSAERSRIPGLEPDRSTVIISGTAIVLEIMQALALDVLQVSDAGVLEGILIQKVIVNHHNEFDGSIRTVEMDKKNPLKR